MKDIEQAAEEFAFKSLDEVILYGCTLSGRRACFIEGAKWDRSQMPKEAVEGEFQNTPFPTICLDDCKNYDFNDGDKVRVIILKKEDEK